MKILFIGWLGDGQTSQMRMTELRDLGHEVLGVDSAKRWSDAGYISRQVQQAVCRGPTVSSLNSDVLQAASALRPELVWAEKQEYLRPETLHALKKSGSRLLHFTPDPYFTLSWKRTRLTDEALPLFDYLVTSKRYELDQYEAVGPHVIYMPLGFSEKVHRPVCPSTRAQFENLASEVSFLGGWEPRRATVLSRIANEIECSLNVRGYGWEYLDGGFVNPRRWMAMRRNAGNQPFEVRSDPALAHAVRGPEVYGDEYAWALASSKIGLGFLRRICPDQHTTRTFEIPACGSMLLADRTSEHEAFFDEGKEAEFFDGDDELMDKLGFYLSHEEARAEIALQGYERCHRSGYSYRARLHRVLSEIAA